MAQGTCSIEGCERPIQIPSRGWCRMHYQRWHRGDPLVTKPKPSICSVAGCENGGKLIRGWCQTHYTRWLRHGDPTVVFVLQRPYAHRQAILEQGAAGATGDCIILPASPRNPRPTARINGRHVPASRAVWIMVYGDPGELAVLHTCNGGSGTNGCVNIRHLYLGSYAENARDAVASGRTTRGERSHTARLSASDVLAIRQIHAEGGVTMAALALQYAVDAGHISRIINRHTWKHI